MTFATVFIFYEKGLQNLPIFTDILSSAVFTADAELTIFIFFCTLYITSVAFLPENTADA